MVIGLTMSIIFNSLTELVAFENKIFSYYYFFKYVYLTGSKDRSKILNMVLLLKITIPGLKTTVVNRYETVSF